MSKEETPLIGFAEAAALGSKMFNTLRFRVWSERMAARVPKEWAARRSLIFNERRRVVGVSAIINSGLNCKC